MNPKDECEALMNQLLPLAQHLLEKNREFYPIGAVTDARDDSIVQTATCDGNEFPDSQNVIRSLVESHRELARQKQIKVSGIAYNASVTLSGRPIDAIILRLEHESGYSVTVGVPYRRTLFKKVKYGDLFAQAGEHEVF